VSQKPYGNKTFRVDIPYADKGILHIMDFDQRSRGIGLRVLIQFIGKYPEVTMKKPPGSFKVNFLHHAPKRAYSLPSVPSPKEVFY
jgi:hypothetical protein